MFSLSAVYCDEKDINSKGLLGLCLSIIQTAMHKIAARFSLADRKEKTPALARGRKQAVRFVSQETRKLEMKLKFPSLGLIV